MKISMKTCKHAKLSYVGWRPMGGMFKCRRCGCGVYVGNSNGDRWPIYRRVTS